MTENELQALVTAVCYVGERAKQQATGHVSTADATVKAARKAASLILNSVEGTVKLARKTPGLILKPLVKPLG